MAPPPVSCGVLFDQARTFIREQVDPAQHMEAGFMAGQMEKVYLGACLAAVFSVPAGEEWASLRLAAPGLAQIYGLSCRTEGGEVWVFANQWAGDLHALTVIHDTSSTHTIRGLLCGIPPARIDPTWNPMR